MSTLNLYIVCNFNPMISDCAHTNIDTAQHVFNKLKYIIFDTIYFSSTLVIFSMAKQLLLNFADFVCNNYEICTNSEVK